MATPRSFTLTPSIPMLLERRTVSRKTPGDGKLEISEEAAFRLREEFPAPFALRVNGAAGRGRVATMPCTCARAGGAHEHHFLESELLRALVPERAVELAFGGGGVEVRDAGG
ncbi:MAG TPA: hypothetical protein VFS05_09540 [Gemmatimonadaceae bacterium]|nr:hypothetical protein [Gemmatimonadaceae bacterium]